MESLARREGCHGPIGQLGRHAPRFNTPADTWQDRAGGVHRHQRTGRDLCTEPRSAVRCRAEGGPRSAADPVLLGLHSPVAVGLRRLIRPLLARTPTHGRDPHPCDGFAPTPGQDHRTPPLGGMQENTE